ncbi:MAG TPA: condensation domain-containing protein, partial [Pyrinomonadaceae bacterium]|nr:condensation domain-containing protein [Pyrinomonadaceae bacterium]
MSNAHIEETIEGVAVIGMAGRFPGARNLDEFWRNLRDGVEAVTFFSDEELAAEGVSADVMSHPNYVRAGAVLDDIEMFDAQFFGFSPREAEIIDPQHRFFLECAWEALESAGYNSEAYQGPIGVFGGMHMSKYLLNNLLSNPEVLEAAGALQIRIWNDKDFLASLAAYKLNLRGPSITVQTACSTSLVATALACQSLLNYQCDMALAGGVTISVPQRVGSFFQEGVLSPDGHCRAFDAKGQGTVGGNGVGVVVLKRLAEALADGDSIQAVIKGSALNNDGSFKIGYTAPSMEGQMEVIGLAQALAGVEPETISYVEAHGTGTPLGDPIEVAALTEVFRAGTDKKGFCGIGSVKTNIGHLDAAAGVASLIKTVLALKHRQLPPSLNFEQPNPKIDFANSPFRVNDKLTEWKRDGAPRRAGVSSFAMGGVNSHVIVEEAPEIKESSDSRPWQALMLSAKTTTALERMTANLLEHLREHPEQKLADVAYTLHTGRRTFNHRRVVLCQSADGAANALETRDAKRMLSSVGDAERRPVIFMFPGQGAQYLRMAADLYEHEPTFRAQLKECAGILDGHLGFDLLELLYPSDERAAEAAERLNQTLITQPALFAVEYSLARVWMGWGVRPAAMIGHSIGEYVAAALAGVFSLEDALALVAERARLMQQLPAGAMLAVSLPEEEVLPLLKPGLSLAAVNSAALCVVAGLNESVEALRGRLAAQGVECRRLHTSHAFHSGMVEPILKTFVEKVQRITLREPELPYASNVTGRMITAAEATSPEYWARHLRQTVRFADGLGELLQDANAVLLEVGPGRMLGTLARRHPRKTDKQLILSTLRHPQETQADVAFLLNSLGRLWLAGLEIDWPKFYAHERRLRVPLPTYPFDYQRYWIEPRNVSAELTSRPADVGSEVVRSAENADAAAAVGAPSSEAGSAHRRPELSSEFVAARNETEEKLAAIWSKFLGFEQIGVHDDFFELGGHSLLATQIVSRVRETFNITLPIGSFFEEPTVSGLAERVTAAAEGARTSVESPPVRPVARDAHLPLSFAQQRMWFFNQLDPGSAAYNIPAALRLNGALNIAALESSLNEITARHEILRTTFRIEGERPVQVVAPELKIALSLVNLDDLPEAEREAEVGRLASEEARRPFDLETGPLMRVSLLRLKEEEHVLVLTIHHITTDGWSMGIFFRELEVLYHAFSNEEPTPLTELPIQYADFAHWQRQFMSGEVLDEQLAYWKQQLADLPAVLDLPTDRPQPAEPTFTGALKSFNISGRTYAALQELNREEGTTLFMVLLAAYQTLLSRYTGQDDIAVGSPIANRNRSELEGLIGFFVNTLVMRTKLSGNPTFRELLRRVREVALGAYAHQDLPFEQLVEALQPDRDTGRSALFQTMLVVQNAPFGSQGLSSLTFSSVQVDRTAAMFDLTLYFSETEDGISATLEYNTDLFDETTIERLVKHFEQLLESAAADPETRIDELTLLTAAERQEVLTTWNDTSRDYPRDKCLHELFEEQARRTPEATALVFGGERVSYRELDGRANRLAHHLRGMGVGPESLVGVLLERGAEMV